MSYVKLPLVCQDYPLGRSTYNQACENLTATRAAWGEQHGIIEQTPPRPYEGFGQHNDPRIPRIVIDVYPTNAAAGSVAIITGPGSVSGNGGHGVLRRIYRHSTGIYSFEMAGPKSSFFGRPEPYQDSNGVVRFCRAVGFGPPSGGSGIVSNDSAPVAGVVVNCYELSAGSFVNTDFAFSIAIYAT